MLASKPFGAKSKQLAQVGEIKEFAGIVAPNGWLFCHGQTLNIADKPALFAVIGNVYGGDGVTTFALPDRRGKFGIGASDAESVGIQSGSDSVLLSVENLPTHSHTMTLGTTSNGGLLPNSGHYLTATTSGNPTAAAIYTASPVNPVQSAAGSEVGENEPIDITPPALSMNYIIYAG